MNDSSVTSNTTDFGKLSYLIVDDFESFRLSMREMLRSFGAEKIESAAKASPAIQFCAYNHVDVVLCDFNLGDGKNGQHILEELRHKKLLKRSSIFLMITAETSKEMVMGAREYQPDAYLTKPINRAMLVKRLDSLVSQRAALLPINREIDRENYPEAISLCLKYLPTQPRYKTWLMKTLADLYYQVGDFSHALKIYQDVLHQRDLSWASLGHGRILLATGNVDEAAGTLTSLVEKHPDYMEAYDLLAEALEKKGKPVQAQRILEKAAELSPNALLRQKQLAGLAASNQDLSTASEAWKKTVSLGVHSIHDSSEHYLALGQSLSDLSEGDTSSDGYARADEALATLRRMERRFPEEENIKVRSRVVQSRVHAGQGNQMEANKALESVSEELANSETIDPELGIDYAKTLFRLDRDSEAKELLGTLSQRCADDPVLLKKIENLLDEPVGFQQKLKARGLNRDGIKAFESDNLDEAIKTFNEALTIVPDHAALNLNLCQVLMKKQQTTGDTQLLSQASKHLERLANLPEQHRQYRRLVSLRKKLQGMME
ncbi:tetratricopeptide repeat protein [Marinobacter confluentis]|uniref:Tetratricopeptide repeat protein n=1 Tax=Marinobacter confluentis TaxID=1697557 RepID=A0A4Z1CCV0_9GAMM|nr:tetratricopeptide repeat protein [Marinobacter confluentis]TGN41983.1 tetratricopeptide repeat protein [Marinobacter confluentis]